MGRNQTKTCNVCFKSMRSDNLKKHMKRHERGNEDNFITRELYDGKTEDNVATKEQKISLTSVTDEDLAKRVLAQIKEFNRKIKLGINLKLTVDKHGYNVNRLSQDMKYALKTYEGLSQHMKDALKPYEGLSQIMMETLKTYELHVESKEKNMYKCTYCRNWKADGEIFHER